MNEYAEVVKAKLNRIGIAPPGLEVATVTVLIGNERRRARKRPSVAPLSNVGPGDSVFITFQLQQGQEAQARPTVQPAQSDEAQPITVTTKQLAEMIEALASAEQTPGHSFVALKWFRDVYLPGKHKWAESVEVRNRALRRAIDDGLIAVNRLANPKNPNFPTSALRVNRGNAEVQRILGSGKPANSWDFTPIKISGEPMSETLRRMREDARY